MAMLITDNMTRDIREIVTVLNSFNQWADEDADSLCEWYTKPGNESILVILLQMLVITELWSDGLFDIVETRFDMYNKIRDLHDRLIHRRLNAPDVAYAYLVDIGR